MGLFDVFTFKTEAGKVFSKANINYLLNEAKDLIIDLAKDKIAGSEKKEIVDTAICGRIKGIAFNCKNGIVLWLLDKLLGLVPTITQNIYDNLKAKIENL